MNERKGFGISVIINKTELYYTDAFEWFYKITYAGIERSKTDIFLKRVDYKLFVGKAKYLIQLYNNRNTLR